MIVKSVHVQQAHVLVHCSDGWDRTAQLSSLAQICLDPYYRTLTGLQMVIEKEWVGFGHKFQDRYGHLCKMSQKKDQDKPNIGQQLSAVGNNFSQAAKSFLGSKNLFGIKPQDNPSLMNSSESITPKNVAPKEISHVFPQFLDCLYQIWTQFPTHFEYDEKLLGFLFTHLYSCQFGNFLFNNEKHRTSYVSINQLPIDQSSLSIWDYISTHKEHFLNPLYSQEKPLDKAGTGRMDAFGSPGSISPCGRILFPSSLNLKYWTWFYFKSHTPDPDQPLADESINGELQMSSLQDSMKHSDPLFSPFAESKSPFLNDTRSPFESLKSPDQAPITTDAVESPFQTIDAVKSPLIDTVKSPYDPHNPSMNIKRSTSSSEPITEMSNLTMKDALLSPHVPTRSTPEPIQKRPHVSELYKNPWGDSTESIPLK